jgi:hypothetical protein
MLIISFDIKGIDYLQRIHHGRPTESIQHTAVTLYGDRLKMCEDLVQKFGSKRTGCCITTIHSFSPGCFDQKQHDVCPAPTLLTHLGILQLLLFA